MSSPRTVLVSLIDRKVVAATPLLIQFLTEPNATEKLFSIWGSNFWNLNNFSASASDADWRPKADLLATWCSGGNNISHSYMAYPRIFVADIYGEILSLIMHRRSFELRLAFIPFKVWDATHQTLNFLFFWNHIEVVFQYRYIGVIEKKFLQVSHCIIIYLYADLDIM